MERTRTKWDRAGEYFLCFFLYAVIGWCYEVFLEVVVYRWGYSDRGVLFGPYCVVYGFGALAFLFVLYGLLRGKSLGRRLMLLPVIFLGCMAIATAIELLASYLCEAVTGSWPWQTYKDYAINFQGRIALSPSLRFGLGGCVFLYLVQPLLDRLLGALRLKTLRRCCFILAAILGADVLATALKLVLG